MVAQSGLEGCPCVRVSLCGLCVPSGRAESDMSTGRVFPQGVLAAITLVGGGAGAGGAGARGRCERGLLSSVAYTALLGWAGPKLLVQKP